MTPRPGEEVASCVSSFTASRRSARPSWRRCSSAARMWSRSTSRRRRKAQRADPLKEAALAARLAGLSTRVLPQARGVGGVSRAQARPAGDGVRDAVRTGGVPQHPDPRHDPVPPCRCCRPIAARARSTGRSSGRDGDRPLDLLARQRGLDTGDVLLQKKTPIGPHRHRSARSISTASSPWESKPCWKPVDPGEGGQGAAHQAGRPPRPPMKAAAARTMRISTGAGPGRTSTGSSAAAIRRPLHGRRSAASSLKIFDAQADPGQGPRKASPARWARSSLSRAMVSSCLRRRPLQGHARASPPMARRSRPASGRRLQTSPPEPD